MLTAVDQMARQSSLPFYVGRLQNSSIIQRLPKAG
jgi:hypothetical protein